MTIIIVEGPDGAGKSTLVSMLSGSLFEYNVEEGRHGTGTRDRMWETTVDRTYDAIGRDLNPAKPALLWDRMFYSELVYAPVMGRPNAFGTTSNYVHRLITYTGSPVIFCMPGLDIVRENCAKTPQHEWVNDNVERIYRRYQQVIGRYSNNNTLIWDYTTHDPHDEGTWIEWQDLIHKLRTYISNRRQIA